MRVLIALLAILVTHSVLGREQGLQRCVSNHEVLGARFELISYHGDEGKPVSREFTLWRDNARVFYDYAGSDKTEVWERLKNGRLRVTHYFDSHQRGIAYDPVEIQLAHSEADWQNKSQLITTSFIAGQVEAARGEAGCHAYIEYHGAAGEPVSSLTWMPNLHLPADYQQIQNGTGIRLRLLELVSDQAQVKAAFAKRERMVTTDYTDVGDNESDPFLRRMIHLGHIAHGASGFYDADGHQLQGGHAH